METTDLGGLDYFTVEQAARYCGLSVSAFRDQAQLLGLTHGNALLTRRVLYRRTDLQKAIEWHGFGGAATAPRRRGR